MNDWEMYTIPEGTPYWHNRKLSKSTWDSPTLVLTSLLMNGIESDSSTRVAEWLGIEGTPFIHIVMQTGSKKDVVKDLFLHRLTK